MKISAIKTNAPPFHRRDNVRRLVSDGSLPDSQIGKSSPKVAIIAKGADCATRQCCRFVFIQIGFFEKFTYGKNFMFHFVTSCFVFILTRIIIIRQVNLKRMRA